MTRPDMRTHHAMCHETHHACALKRIEKLEEALRRALDRCAYEWCGTPRSHCSECVEARKLLAPTPGEKA